MQKGRIATQRHKGNIKGGDYKYTVLQLIISTTVRSPDTETRRKGQHYDVEVNEEELRFDEPVLNGTMPREYPEQKLKKGTNAELQRPRNFDTYVESRRTDLTKDQLRNI